MGERLARIARAVDYGEDIVYSGPVYKSIEIAGADGIYFDALADIIGDTVQVSSNSVSTPVKVRYAW